MNLTLLNSYRGVRLIGSCQHVSGLFGTVLSEGVRFDNSYEISELLDVGFSADFWHEYDGTELAKIRALTASCRPILVGKQDDFMIYDVTVSEDYSGGLYLFKSEYVPDTVPFYGQSSYGFNMNTNGLATERDAFVTENFVDTGNAAFRNWFVDLDEMGDVGATYGNYDFRHVRYPKAKTELRNVRNFGAKGTGTADDTEAFRTALKEAAKTGGTVYVPAGNYRITGKLTIPEGVELRGAWDAPHLRSPSKLSLAFGKDAPDEAMIELREASGAHGLTFVLPEYSPNEPDRPFSWVLRGSSENMYVENCSFPNAYNGMDFSAGGENLFIGGIWMTAMNETARFGGGMEKLRVQLFFSSFGVWWEDLHQTDLVNHPLFQYYNTFAKGITLGDVRDSAFFSTTMWGQQLGMESVLQDGKGPENLQFIRLMLDLPYGAGARAWDMYAGDRISVSYLSAGVMDAEGGLLTAKEGFSGKVRVYHEHLFGLAPHRLGNSDVRIFHDGETPDYIEHNLSFDPAFVHEASVLPPEEKPEETDSGCGCGKGKGAAAAAALLPLAWIRRR